MGPMPDLRTCGGPMLELRTFGGLSLKDGGAPAYLRFAQTQSFADRDQDISAARMQKPALHIVTGDGGPIQHARKDLLDLFGSQVRDLGRKDIAEHAALLFEPEQIAVARIEQ